MRLYRHPLSFNSRRVMLAATHMGTPLELSDVDLGHPDSRLYLSTLNPNGKVPVLDDGGFLLWESSAIMQYLAERTLGQTLYPENIRMRADINRWMTWSSQHFGPFISVVMWEKVWKSMSGGGAADPVEVARGLAGIAQYAAILDAHLAGRQWMVGDDVTLADYAVAAPLMYLIPGGLPVTQYANVMAWYGRVQELDAWKHTEPVW